MKRVRTIAIAGAGLSGLAIAVALRDRGFDGSIAILDAKLRFEDDRTWCWWKIDGIPFAEIANRRWTRCRVSYAGRHGTAESTEHPYLQLSGAAYYAACMAYLVRTGTTVSLGEPIIAIDDGGESARVRTTRRDLRADLIVDARGQRDRAPLHQHFFGIQVIADEPVFDPQTVTLMDFARARSGIRFVYVLPFSRYEALVEDTVVDGAAPDSEERRLGIERYLYDRYGLRTWREVRTEAGAIPLDARYVPPFASPRVVRAGIGAGTTRASSGYTYVRTHRHAHAIADFVTAGRPLRSAGSPVYGMLDALALKGLRCEAIDVPHILTELFARASGDALARFLSDAASPRDILDVLGAIARAFPSALQLDNGRATSRPTIARKAPT